MKLDMLSLGSGWQMKVNGDRALTLAAGLAEFALVCFEPGSHALISGGSAERRRFLDWVLFHVEHGYIVAARDYPPHAAAAQRASEGARDRKASSDCGTPSS